MLSLPGSGGWQCQYRQKRGRPWSMDGLFAKSLKSGRTNKQAREPLTVFTLTLFWHHLGYSAVSEQKSKFLEMVPPKECSTNRHCHGTVQNEC